MRLEYRLKFGDYLLFNAVHQLLNLPLQALCLLVAWYVYSVSVAEFGTPFAVLEGIVVYLGLWVFQLLFNVLYLYSSKNKSLLTDHVVEVQEDAFLEQTRYNKSFHYWPGIVKVLQAPGFVAVYVTANMAHVVPRRAFSSAEQVNGFVRMVRERIQAARPRQT